MNARSKDDANKEERHELDLSRFLCFALYSTSRSLTQLYAAYLEEAEITYPQLLVFILLWRHQELSVNQIGRELFLDSGTLTPLLKRLEARDLITRTRSKKDERSVLVKLAPAGLALSQKIQGSLMQMLCDAQMLPNEVEPLVEQLHNVRGRVEKLLGEKKHSTAQNHPKL